MTLTTISDPVGILGFRRFPSYKDEPGRLYHYPQQYRSRIEALSGNLVLLYEPRRGGENRDSSGGGRSAFVGWATLGDTWPDPADPTHSFVELRGACEFARPVPLSETEIKPVVVRSAVSSIPVAVALLVLQSGLSRVMESPEKVSEGLVDLSCEPELANRSIREVISSRPVRERSFRARVIGDAYAGRCALSGIRLLNGRGRAEADAAHIRPVENGGPDTVQNGIALTKTLHWAFDRGLVSLSDDGTILTVQRGLDDDLRRLLRQDSRALLPSAPVEQPHPSFLLWHRSNVFKGAA